MSLITPPAARTPSPSISIEINQSIYVSNDHFHLIYFSIDQALAKSAEAAAAEASARNAAGDDGENTNETEGKVPDAVRAIEAKLAGAPPPSVAVALRADSASEGRRDVVRAMFEVAWWPMLGAFSQVCVCGTKGGVCVFS